jgi:hypothetical protein
MVLATGVECLIDGGAEGCPSGTRCWGEDGTGLAVCWPDCDAFTCDGECDEDGSCIPPAGSDCDPGCGSICTPY